MIRAARMEPRRTPVTGILSSDGRSEGDQMNRSVQLGFILMFMAFYAKYTGGPSWVGNPDTWFTAGVVSAIANNMIENVMVLFFKKGKD